MILAGDMGGTKTRLALFRRGQGGLEEVRVETYPSDAPRGFNGILLRFLETETDSIDAACLGVPGPVIRGVVDTTNLPERISEEQLRQRLGCARVRLVNDLVATAASIPALPRNAIEELHPGIEDDEGPRRCVVLAPGTGLGQAMLVIDDGPPRAYPSEGGHADFSPTSEREIELLRFLLKRFSRVSWERVLSGPGLENIYDFLCAEGRHEEPVELKRRLQEEDRAKVISEAGLKREFPLCVEALDLFASLLGSHAGNLALSFRANGGVYLGGGIPPKIIEKLREGATVRAFLDKSRMAELVADMPLRVILDDHAALLGAAAIAEGLLKSANRPT